MIQELLKRSARIVSRKSYRVYARELSPYSQVYSSGNQEVEFQINSPDVKELLINADGSSPMEYGDSEENLARIARGEAGVSGWLDGVVVFHGWILFNERHFAKGHSVSLMSGSAFIYRCHTHPSFRGRKIYPAALEFCCGWLAANGYKRVFIDHQIGNVASEKGINMIGMRPIGDFSIANICGKRWVMICDDLLAKISQSP